MTITSKDIRAMSLATKMLKCSQHPKYRISAVLMKGGRVISVGINKQASYKRFTNPHRRNMALHAEIDCLLGIDKEKSKNSTLYCIGLTRSGKIICSNPCFTCRSMIMKMRIKRIVYVNGEHEIVEQKI